MLDNIRLQLCKQLLWIGWPELLVAAGKAGEKVTTVEFIILGIHVQLPI